MKIFKRFLAVLVLCVTLVAQDLTTPEYVHAPLLLKIIKEDAQMMKATSPVYNIAIVYDEEDDESLENQKRIQSFFEEQKIALETVGLSIKTHNVKFSSKGKFYADMDNKKIHLMYICSQIEEDVVKRIKFVSENLSILTLSGSEDIYEYGASITVKLNDDDIPQLIMKKGSFQKERKALAIDYTKVANLSVEHP